MADITNEMKEKLLVAKSAEEAAALLKESGVDETTAKHLWEEMNRKREANGGKLSLDELEAVSGGARYRNWKEEGCAATVEPGSWCGSDDRCDHWEVCYSQGPLGSKCPRCGGYLCYDDYYIKVSEKYGYCTVAPTNYCRVCGYRVNTISDVVYS